MVSSSHFRIAVVFLVGVPAILAKPYNFNEPQWPAECGDKSFCFTKPVDYPQETFDKILGDTELELMPSSLENRTSTYDDVGHCKPKKTPGQLYMIKDENNRSRYVAQTRKYKIEIVTEECETPGRINASDFYYIEEKQLEENNVHCYETKSAIQFIVLSLDGSSLDSVAVKGGLPLSCSAKIMH